MLRAIRLLRIVLPITFLVFVGVIVISYSSSARRRTADEPRRTERPPPAGEGEPQLITHQFEDAHSIGGRTVSKITAARTIGFSSGWHSLEDIEMTVYRTDGGRYVVSAPSARFKADTKRAEVRGGVRVQSPDGIEISTREIDFDGRRLTNAIPVRFTVDQWQGEALGVDLDVDRQTQELLEKVRATMLPSAVGVPPTMFSSDSAIFDRSVGEARFEGHVAMRRGADELRASRMIARFDQSKTVLLGIEGTGEVTIRLGPDLVVAEGGSGAREIHGDHLSIETGPDGEVRAATLQGEDRPARAVLRGNPDRFIEAERLRVGLDQSVVRSIEANGRAELSETVGGVARTATAMLVRAYVDGVTGAFTSAYMEGDVTFRSDDVTARSERANYSVADDRLVLTAESGSAPTIESETERLRAEVIEVAPASGLLRARGRVVARLVRMPGASESALFPGGTGEMFANADSAVINQNDGSAVFSGHVKAWQGNNTLFAAELQLGDRGASIQARGDVRTTLYNTRGTMTAPMTTSSERLFGKRADRSIALNGHVVVGDGDRSVHCDEAQFQFDADRSLERITSTGSVTLDEAATGRKGSGTKVVYEVGPRRIVIDGDPATMTDTQGTIKGRRIVFEIEKNRVDVVRGTEPTEATIQPHGSGSTD